MRLHEQHLVRLTVHAAAAHAPIVALRLTRLFIPFGAIVCAQHAEPCATLSRAAPAAFVNGAKCLGCGVVLLDLQGLFAQAQLEQVLKLGMGFEQFFKAFDRVRDVGVGKALFGAQDGGGDTISLRLLWVFFCRFKPADILLAGAVT